jgi:hypothetical protein
LQHLPEMATVFFSVSLWVGLLTTSGWRCEIKLLA